LENSQKRLVLSMPMKTPTVGALSAVIDSFCKENGLKFSAGRGGKPKMPFAEVLTVFTVFFLSRRKDFKAFYFGTEGPPLRTVFPNLTGYSAVLRRLPLVGEILFKFLQSGQGKGFFDSISFKLCEDVRFRRMRLFPNFARWAHSSTRCIFGFKLHLAINERGGELSHFV
jgi:hypothetical protein